MKNPLTVEDTSGSKHPKEIYGYRPYLLSFSAAWVSRFNLILSG